MYDTLVRLHRLKLAWVWNKNLCTELTIHNFVYENNILYTELDARNNSISGDVRKGKGAENLMPEGGKRMLTTPSFLKAHDVFDGRLGRVTMQWRHGMGCKCVLS